MAVTTVEDFDVTRVTNLSTKFQGEETAESFGCLGEIDGESEIQTIVKNCEGIQVKQKSTVTKLTLTLTAHVKTSVFRKLFGISNDGLAPGVYAYGSASKFGNFCLTADEIDEFQNVTKLIAFPNCSSTKGLVFKIENGADEVAELEMEFDAMQDDFKNCYYEAIVNELEDQDLIDQWHTDFNHDLVKLTSP